MKNYKFSHFKQRAWQRYKINLSTEDCQEIQSLISEENKIGKATSGGYIHLISFANRGFYCVASRNKKLSTILTKEYSENAIKRKEKFLNS